MDKKEPEKQNMRQPNPIELIPDDVMVKMKFYTAWVIWCEDTITNEILTLHCTHKYLGGQTQNTMGAVFRIIKKYMHNHGEGGWPRANFTQREEFGGPCTCSGLVNANNERQLCENCAAGRKPISVLTTPDPVEAFWPFLRAELDQFRADDYPEYRPHISVPNYPSVVGHFQAYAIMNGDRALIYWGNPHWEKIEKAMARRNGMHAVPSAVERKGQ